MELPEPEQNKNKKYLRTAIIIITIGIAVLKVLNGDDKKTKYLKHLTKSYSSELPKTLDGNTRWDSVSYDEDSNLVCYHTLLNFEADVIDRTIFIDEIGEKVDEEYESSSDFEDIRDLGISIIYNYSGKNGKFIASIKVPRE